VKTTIRKLLMGGALTVLGVAFVGLLYVYVASERIIHRHYDAPFTDIPVPTDVASIAEGERLAKVHGCNNGCHGKQVGGQLWNEGAFNGTAMAPDLARVARTLSTAEFVRIVRRGVRVNGEGVEIMPSAMFYHLSDEDLGKILAFLRQTGVTDGHTYAFNPGPGWRWQMVRGEWLPWPEDIMAMGPRMRVPDPADTVRYGEYLARTVCTECHGLDLNGDKTGTPNLVIARAYSPEAFNTLMRTGKALGNRELELMSDTARERFANLTDAEVRALYAYLQARGGNERR
jgi:mono/diheme cytochrome c family protein